METSEKGSRFFVLDSFSLDRRTYNHFMQPEFNESYYPLDAGHRIPCGSTLRYDGSFDPFGSSSYHFRGL